MQLFLLKPRQRTRKKTSAQKIVHRNKEMGPGRKMGKPSILSLK
jgi:hypothetical protein